MNTNESLNDWEDIGGLDYGEPNSPPTPPTPPTPPPIKPSNISANILPNNHVSSEHEVKEEKTSVSRPISKTVKIQQTGIGPKKNIIVDELDMKDKDPNRPRAMSLSGISEINRDDIFSPRPTISSNGLSLKNMHQRISSSDLFASLKNIVNVNKDQKEMESKEVTIELNTTTDKIIKGLEEIFTDELFPAIRKTVIDKLVIIISSADMSWVGKALLLQQIMQVMRNLELSGEKKKLIVKQIFKLIARELVEDDQARQLLEIWIDEDGDMLIDQFVSIAPKLFKRATWEKIWQSIQKTCSCCCKSNKK